jgi:hypothetical protein
MIFISVKYYSGYWDDVNQIKKVSTSAYESAVPLPSLEGQGWVGGVRGADKGRF